MFSGKAIEINYFGLFKKSCRQKVSLIQERVHRFFPACPPIYTIGWLLIFIMVLNTCDKPKRYVATTTTITCEDTQDIDSMYFGNIILIHKETSEIVFNVMTSKREDVMSTIQFISKEYFQMDCDDKCVIEIMEDEGMDDDDFKLIWDTPVIVPDQWDITTETSTNHSKEIGK